MSVREIEEKGKQGSGVWEEKGVVGTKVGGKRVLCPAQLHDGPGAQPQPSPQTSRSSRLQGSPPIWYGILPGLKIKHFRGMKSLVKNIKCMK